MILPLAACGTQLTGVSRLHTVRAFGSKLGDALQDLFTAHPAWIDAAYNAIGSTDVNCGPPPDAINAVTRLIREMTHMVVDDAVRPQRSALTNVNGHLLGAWQKAAGDPDDQVETWLIEGGPA